MSIKDELRAEMIETQAAYHRLLAEIPDEALSLPSDNPAWTVGEVLFHMSLAPRFMVTDLKAIISRPFLAKVLLALVPGALFHRFNERYTRYGTQGRDRNFLAAQYDRAHARALRALDAVEEADFQKSVQYPGYDPLLSGTVTVEGLFRYIKLHFEAHAEQIRERARRSLV